jgi:hypothetical protein
MPKGRKAVTTEPTTYSGSLVLRVPPSILERLEAYAAKRSEAGARFTRADAARVLLLDGLDRAEGKQR